jgi:hypothetical protein
MTGSSFTLTGTENLKRIFQEFPEGGYRKPVMASFRKAAKPVAEAMANSLPSNIKGLKKIIKITTAKGKSLFLSVGFKGGISTYRNSRGQDWDPWQLVYWFNYGTLANRLVSHQFKTPRRKASASRSGGIRPGRFVEEAWENSKGKAQKIFEVEVDKEITKFFEKHAAK